jgi:hypothetical protein
LWLAPSPGKRTKRVANPMGGDANAAFAQDQRSRRSMPVHSRVSGLRNFAP